MAKENGRPTKYKKEYDEQAAKLCKLGATDVQLADFFNVTEKTLNNWKHEHPRFLQSLKKGKVFSDDKVEAALYDRAIGYEYEEVKEEQSEQGMKRTVTTKRIQDNTAAIFWLKNRRPEQWREKVENDTVQDINIVIDHAALGIKSES
ncbi:MAG: hypothetical protein GY787_03005 [Alteromonadales bacterium]|nr:hypothetical protein [Alteromonadales bacterium]MCP4879359.1 hypothetical protein [Gammaproteobacteria bacterium]